MELSLCCYFKLELSLKQPEYIEMLFRSKGFLMDNKILHSLKIPDEFRGGKFRSIMDAVLHKIFPIFDEEMYNFYVNSGPNLKEIWGIKGCKIIDEQLLNALQQLLPQVRLRRTTSLMFS